MCSNYDTSYDPKSVELWSFTFPEHNQGFGLMSSLVANRHNTFRSGANPPVSHIYVLNVCMSCVLQ